MFRTLTALLTLVAATTPVAVADPPTGSLGTSQVAPADNLPSTFDLQAHRGGRGEHTEESRAAFGHALELGVTTLELDVHLSADGVPVVWHDASVQADKCTGDYVGQDVHDLTWEQLQTLNCNLPLADYPEAVHAADNRMLQLTDVFDIAARDPQVYFNIETKIEAEAPERSAPAGQYVDAILDAAEDAGTTDRIAVQSFDWSSLPLVRERAPQVPLVALWDETTWTADSPYLGPVDYGDGDVLAAARNLGVEVLSPGFRAVEPSFVAQAQEAGFRVVPWTVNEAADMERYLDAGVDGIITDYPTRLAGILEERGIAYR
ncbi:glycerophosphodiester phosphodiesterase family protein [Corynebacterium kalidii]|uniref:Glycerophosphodiester phosphodiesterase n=1 Tax=Corynebacterium kalidii TaxID=2931982 RepID=A0A9X2AYJ3_9CORY|nr:glycerophosphodiester phosphodiesterase family protein [Corynebacterium kalidii]MCJ7857668.1 glycerophosphodiester phosphodiesterase [Corynebacterium kalidii]